MLPVSSIGRAASSFWTHGRHVERFGYVVGALLIVSGLIHLAILLFTGASWEGPLSLRKATTFGLSFGLTLISVTWVMSFLHLGDRIRALQLAVFTMACVLETALVSLQAWRGVPSHFNLETTFDALIARTLAAGGFILVALITAFTIAAFRTNSSLPTSLLTAIRIGFAMLIAAVVVGALMIARGMLLVFAGEPQAAYATGGRLKPTHFVTMHAILVLPALAWLLSFVNWSEQRRRRVVLVAASGYVACAGVIAVGDFTGLGLTSMPLGSIGLLGVLSVLATGIFVIRGVAHAHTSNGIQHRRANAHESC